MDILDDYLQKNNCIIVKNSEAKKLYNDKIFNEICGDIIYETLDGMVKGYDDESDDDVILLIIIKNGKPIAVVVSNKEFHELEAFKEQVLKLAIAEGLNDLAKGKTHNHHDIFNDLKKKIDDAV